MAEPSTESMVREAQGRRAGTALQVASEVLDTRESKIIAGVMKTLKDGPLGADNAIQQWIALSEVQSLRRALEVIETKGQSAAKRNAHLRTPIG